MKNKKKRAQDEYARQLSLGNGIPEHKSFEQMQIEDDAMGQKFAEHIFYVIEKYVKKSHFPNTVPAVLDMISKAINAQSKSAAAKAAEEVTL